MAVAALSAINPKMIDLAQPITPAHGPRSPSSSQVARTYGCQFGCVDRRYSNEHSRRQHYRRHHKAEMAALRESSKGVVKDRKRRSNSLTSATVSPSSPGGEGFMGEYSIYSRSLSKRTSLDEYYEAYGDDLADQAYGVQYTSSGSPLFTPDSAQSTYLAGSGSLFDFGAAQKQQMYGELAQPMHHLLYPGSNCATQGGFEHDNAVFWEDVAVVALDTATGPYIDGFADQLSAAGSYNSPYTLAARSSSFSSDFGSECEFGASVDHYAPGVIGNAWWGVDNGVPGLARGVDPVLGYGREEAMWEGVVDYNCHPPQRRRPLRSMSLGSRREMYDEVGLHNIRGELAQLVRGHPRARHSITA